MPTYLPLPPDERPHIWVRDGDGFREWEAPSISMTMLKNGGIGNRARWDDTKKSFPYSGVQDAAWKRALEEKLEPVASIIPDPPPEPKPATPTVTRYVWTFKAVEVPLVVNYQLVQRTDRGLLDRPVSSTVNYMDQHLGWMAAGSRPSMTPAQLDGLQFIDVELGGSGFRLQLTHTNFNDAARRHHANMAANMSRAALLAEAYEQYRLALVAAGYPTARRQTHDFLKLLAADDGGIYKLPVFEQREANGTMTAVANLATGRITGKLHLPDSQQLTNYEIARARAEIKGEDELKAFLGFHKAEAEKIARKASKA